MLLLLSTDNLNFIFNKLNIIDKKNFILCNTELNKYFGGENLKKYKIEFYIYNDFCNFYKFLNKYSYTEEYLNTLAIKIIKYIPSIYGCRSSGYYDMRYIFEIMYYGIILENNLVERLNKHFYIFFYKNLKDCFINQNKGNNNHKIIQLLKNNYKLIEGNNIYSKTYIKLISDINFYY